MKQDTHVIVETRLVRKPSSQTLQTQHKQSQVKEILCKDNNMDFVYSTEI